MKTKIQLLCIVMAFSFLTTYSQVTPYKINAVKKPTSTSKAIKTMSDSNKKHNTKVTFNAPKNITSYTLKIKPINIDGKKIGSVVLSRVGRNFKPSFNVSKRPITNNQGSNCFNTRLSLKANNLSLGYITDNTPPSWLVPGAIFKTSSILNTKPTPTNDKRKSVKLTALNIDGLGNSIVVENSERLSNLSEGVNQIFSKVKNKSVSAIISAEYKEIHSLQELELFLNGSYSANFGLANLSGTISSSYKSSNEYHFYMVKVRQYLFSIGVDDYDFSQNDFFSSSNVRKNDMVYISNIDYGRVVMVLVKSRLDLKEFEGGLEAKLNTLLSKSELKAGLKSLKFNQNYEIKAFFYGGNTSGAVESLLKTIETKNISISDYLRKDSDRPHLGRPISYTLRSMDGYDVTVNTTINQKIKTCIPEGETIKIRITLENFECQVSGDSDEKDDYIFNQWIIYKNKDGRLIRNSDISMNRNESDNISNETMDFIKVGKDIIFKGDNKHQFNVEEGHKEPIGNSIVFEITPELLRDSYSKFIIRNNLFEATSGGALSVKYPWESMTASSGKINVDIQSVVNDLLNLENVQSGKWTNYGRMKLRKYDNNSTDLYGYINFKNDDRKARAKMRFKIID